MTTRAREIAEKHWRRWDDGRATISMAIEDAIVEALKEAERAAFRGPDHESCGHAAANQIEAMYTEEP